MGDCGEEASTGSKGSAGGMILRPPARAGFPVKSDEWSIVFVLEAGGGSVTTGLGQNVTQSAHVEKRG
jgi:hypothetical protein